jgi:cation:H+ antiporter
LLVLGTLVLIAPVQLAAEVLRFDLWVMAGATVLLVPIMLSGWRISRREGVLFLALYAAYIGAQFASPAS